MHDDEVEVLQPLMNAKYQEVVDFFSTTTGVDYRHKPDVAINKITSFFRSREIPEDSLSLQNIRSDSRLLEEIINLLTVNESYFYREIKQLEILYELTKERPTLSILNAPCSSGEEAYSILLYMLGQNRDISGVKVTGIDINTQVIAQAQSGIYNERKANRIPSALLDDFFQIDNGEYSVGDSLKRQCCFQVLNIFDSEFEQLETYDVVFSRNMLIYFDKNYRAKAEERLYARIKPGGLLFLGHADQIENRFGMEKKNQNGVFWYGKV